MDRRHFFRVGLVTAGAVAGAPQLLPVEVSAAPSRRPRLGVDCTQAELAERARMLAEARKTYVWSLKVENVEGVPMVGRLPAGENPTVDWLIEFLRNFLDLVENLVHSAVVAVIPQLKPAMTGFSAQVLDLKNRFVDLVSQFDTLVKKYDNATLNTVVELTDKYAISTIADIALTILSALQKIRTALFETVERNLTKSRLWIGDFGEKRNLVKYKAMWGSIPLPDVAHRVHDDDFFGYTRVAGPNPMVLEKIREAVPAKFRLDAARVEELAGESLQSAISAGRAYLCDFHMLGAMAKEDATYKVFTGANYNTAPIGLFIRPSDSSLLKPIAIQVGQVAGRSPVFYPPASPRDTSATEYWGWQMAKTAFQTADFNHHEMFSHLATTHLVSEAFCISTHRQLPPGHPLRVLLEPHFEGDLFINNLAAAIIQGPQTFVDQILAPEVHISQSTAGRARLDWNFTEMMPKREMARRGVDDPDLEFPYRDDALLIWSDIESWVGDYVDVYYRDDAAVRGDADLRRWVTEVSTHGRVKGVPRIRTKETLVECLTMVIFTASAQHAAVNYLQRDDMTYAPFYSGTLSRLPTDDTHEYTASDWYGMMPSFLSALAQMYFLNVLGTVYYRRLGDYRTNEFPYPKCVVDRRVVPRLEAFNRRLRNTEREIKGRNTKRHWEYPYLLPSNIPMSTNI